MSLVITGAAGQLGAAVARQVIALRGSAAGLVLATRRPDSVDESLRDAEIRYADFRDPQSLPAAFAGCTRMLLISADDIAARAAWHIAAIDAAEAAGVGHIIYTSMIRPGEGNPAVIAPSHLATEQRLAAGQADFTILRCGLYSDFQVFEAAAALAAGQFLHNRADGRCAYVTRADCAAVAAAVAVSDGAGRRTLDVTGPEGLDAATLAELYAEVGGRAVQAVAVDDEELGRQLLSGEDPDGHAQYGAALVVSLGRATREGFFAQTAPTVAELTGQPPRSVAAVLDEQRPLLRELLAQQHRD